MSFDEDDYYDDYEDMSENESLEDGNTDLLDNSSDASEIEFFPDDSESDSSEIAEDSDSSFDQSSNESSTQTDESNGYIFEVDAESGTTTARGEVKAEPASREGMNAIHPDGYDSSTDKGHLIAAAESGPAEAFNVHAQDSHLNRSQYKTVENAEVRAAKEGYNVQTEKTAYVSHKGSKPDAYMINDTFTSPDGKSQSVHLSFQNASPEEQQQWNETAEQYSDIDEYPNPDPLRDSMSQEEYSSLMEETDAELPSIRDEFDMENTSETSFDVDNSTDSATFSGDAGTNGAQGGDTASGA